MTLTDILTAHQLTTETKWANERYCSCGETVHTMIPARSFAAHVVEEMAAANIVAIELPEVDAYPHGEIEWGFASQGSDGWVNLDKGVITFDLAEDDGGETDGLPTVAEGRVPADLVKPFASALLAAAVRSTPTPGETP